MNRSLLIFTLCLVGIYCRETFERNMVSDAERAEGFSCKSLTRELGLMRAGEERINYKPLLCSKATCDRFGRITIKTCPVPRRMGCQLVSDLSKPYPYCCPYINCDALLKAFS